MTKAKDYCAQGLKGVDALADAVKVTLDGTCRW